MDCFTKLTINGKTQKTEVLKGSGKTPEWNQTLQFENVKSTDTATITVMDYEKWGSNDFVGDTSLPIEKLVAQDSVELKYENETAGQVFIKANLEGFQAQP